MKGNVFSLWLKEFCALVFTQAVQAFILAIVLILVAMSISTSNGLNEDSSEGEQAAGVLAIVALTSLSNMESLVKKIFGLESSVTDSSMKGGKGGLLGTIAAMKMAKKALDNIPKVGQGISGSIRAGNEKRKAQISATNKLNKLNDKYGINSGTGTSSGTSANAASSTSAGSSASAVSNTSAGSSANAASNTSAGSSARSKYDEKYEDKKEKILEEYNKKIEEAKKLGKESRRKITSGVLETTGAIKGGIVGAAMGAVVGAGTGEDILSSATKGLGIGIGLGDDAGKLASGAIYAPYDVKKGVTDYVGTIIKVNNKKNKQAIENLEKELKKFNAGDI